MDKIKKVFFNSFIIQGLTIGIYIGVSTSSFFFMTRYNYLIKTKQQSVLNLYFAGTINFLIIGFLFALLSLPFWFASKPFFHKTSPLKNKLIFFAPFVIYINLVFYFFVFSNLKKFKGVPWSSNARLITYVIAIALAVGYLPLFFSIRVLIQKTQIRPREYLKAAKKVFYLLILIPLLFSLLGIAFGLSKSRRRVETAINHPLKDNNFLSGEMNSKSSKNGSLPNIVFIIIETLRSDHVNSYGYKSRKTTNNLDKIAESGTSFQNVYAQSSWTKPSVSSIFTSLYPQQHGANETMVEIDPSIESLPKILNKVGYQTISYVTTSYAIDNNFGFQFRYDLPKFPPPDPFYISPLSAEPFLKGTAFYYLYQRTVLTPPYNMTHYNDSKKVNYYITRDIAKYINKPFFLYIHYFDPHRPYYRHPYRPIQFNAYSRITLNSLIRNYDEEIMYVDNAIGEILDLLKKYGKARDTILVITSDHGEEFLDHRGWGHGKTLYNEVIKVPLIISYPKIIPANVRIPNASRSIDIAPTLLELIGEKIPAGFEGTSLLQFIFEKGQQNRPILSQFRGPGGWINCWIKDNYKLLARELKTERGSQKSLELFDLFSDGDEKRNIIKKSPVVGERLENELEDYIKKFEETSYPPRKKKVEKEELEKLRALGYIR